MKARRRQTAKDAQPAPAAPSGRVRVSDHALFRWLERAGVVDVERLRMALTVALDRAYQAASKMNQEELLILSGGLVYVVRDGTVITVLSDDGRHNHGASLARLRSLAGEAQDGDDVG